MSNPHDITREFEAALCRYTGAKYAVAVNSCTMALLIALAWWREQVSQEFILLPTHTYVGVPASVRQAGFSPAFQPLQWSGEYALFGSPVWDSARRFTSGMFKGVRYEDTISGNTITRKTVPIDRSGQMICVSFHATKILADTQGGAILHDNDEADAWLRRARFDGRTEGADPRTDQVQYPSWHAYLSPDVAARLLWKLQGLPLHNEDLPNSDYPDLSTLEAFK